MSPSTPAVSVILPVKDSEPFLLEAIDSICGQSLGDIELIIVDGGSTDGSREIAAARAACDRRVRLVAGETLGLVASLELGRRQGKAPLIARMDADDISHPERFAWQHAHLREHSAVVAVGGQIELIDEAGRWCGRRRFPLAPQACREQLDLSAPFCHPTVMMRAEVLEAVGGYRQSAYPAEDYDLWLRLARVGDLANLERTVLLYRRHAGAGTQVQAHANAAAVAVVVASRTGACARNGMERGARPGPPCSWGEIEQDFPEDDRLLARAAYLKALAVNGGICEGDAAQLLQASLPALVGRAGKSRSERNALAFTVDRAAIQLLRQRCYVMAGRFVADGLRLIGREVLADISTSLPRLAYERLEHLWMPTAHSRRQLEWRRLFAAAMDERVSSGQQASVKRGA